MLYEHGGQEKQQKNMKQATNIQTGTSQIRSEISSNFNVKNCFSSLGVCVCGGGGGGGGEGGKTKHCSFCMPLNEIESSKME